MRALTLRSAMTQDLSPHKMPAWSMGSHWYSHSFLSIALKVRRSLSDNGAAPSSVDSCLGSGEYVIVVGFGSNNSSNCILCLDMIANLIVVFHYCQTTGGFDLFSKQFYCFCLTVPFGIDRPIQVAI